MLFCVILWSAASSARSTRAGGKGEHFGPRKPRASAGTRRRPAAAAFSLVFLALSALRDLLQSCSTLDRKDVLATASRTRTSPVRPPRPHHRHSEQRCRAALQRGRPRSGLRSVDADAWYPSQTACRLWALARVRSRRADFARTGRVPPELTVLPRAGYSGRRDARGTVRPSS